MFQGPKGYRAKICETVQQNGRFTLFSSKFSSNIYLFCMLHISVEEKIN